MDKTKDDRLMFVRYKNYFHSVHAQSIHAIKQGHCDYDTSRNHKNH